VAIYRISNSTEEILLHDYVICEPATLSKLLEHGSKTMFESIVVRRDEVGGMIDPGKLAETLLFYEHVHLLLDHGSLVSLLKTVGVDNLLLLMKQNRIRVSFLLDHLATQTAQTRLSSVHSYDAIRVVKFADGRPAKRKARIAHAFVEAIGDSRLSNIKRDKFIKGIRFRDHGVGSGDRASDIVVQARSDLDDERYACEAMRAALSQLIPGYDLPPDFYFKVRGSEREFTCETNLNFSEINARYGRAGAANDVSINTAFLLTHILEARADLFFATEYMAEFSTDPVRSQIIHTKFGKLLQRRFKSRDEISAFQAMHLDEANAIREAINVNERKFSDFLTLLDRADKFRHWLRVQNPDSGLLREYYRAVTADTWAEKLPTKAARFLVFTGAGLLADLGTE
jgi:hypothetical protein